MSESASSATGRRVGSERSKTRAEIVTSAEQLMVEHGHASITFRSVAARAGVTAGLVQYYFPTIDDLFVAVLGNGTDRLLEEIGRVVESEQPLRAMWAYASNATGAALIVEFMAAANHRKDMWDKLGEGGERVRQAWVDALSPRWERYGIAETDLTLAGLVFILTAIGRMARLEEGFGTRTGHDDAIAIVEQFLDSVEPRKTTRTTKPNRRRKA
jgi:AcrR family transcriptional regulator